MLGLGLLRRDSLRAQLLRWLTLPLLLVLMLDAAISYRVALDFANGAYDEGLFDTARALAQQVKTDNGKVEVNLPPQAQEILESDPYDKVFYEVIAPDGRKVSGRQELPLPPLATDAKAPVRYYDADLGHTPIRVAAYSAFDTEGARLFTVLSAETLIKRQILVKNILITVILPQVVIVAVVALLLVHGTRRGLIPLLRLTAAVTRRGHHDLSFIDEVRSPEEVRPLIHAINELMLRLSVVLSAQERFIADAAHQLRTPLAGLSAQAEHALGEHRLEDMRPALEHIKASSKQVTRLVNQLLTLARTEPNANPRREFGRFDLAQLVRQTAMEWVPAALSRRIDLGYAGVDAGVFVEGDNLLFKELLNNLIDNAIRYGNDGGTATVRLTTTPSVVIEVEDDGRGIPEQERERVFERFYRVHGTDRSGCGLGLAIVQQIAQVHGASVSLAAPVSAHGTLVRVAF
jgi:two-component system, OmpR family, sensor histidine kinase TctE